MKKSTKQREVSSIDRRSAMQLGFTAAAVGLLPGCGARTAKAQSQQPSIPQAPSIRSARLFTELTVDGVQYGIQAAGARSCAPTSFSQNAAAGTLVYDLECDLTYFANPDTPLGPVTIIQDPRVTTKGQVLFRRDANEANDWPALSYFNQYLIFHVGNKFYYYPRKWQVVSSITTWPPEYHQYHHLEPDTPIFDYVTGEPDVARKGISTISIEGPLSSQEEQQIRADFASEVALVQSLPASVLTPEDL